MKVTFKSPKLWALHESNKSNIFLRALYACAYEEIMLLLLLLQNIAYKALNYGLYNTFKIVTFMLL